MQTVAFVNSLATSSALWDGVVGLLGPQVSTIRYDQRDRFEADGVRGFTLEDLVDDLLRELDRADTERAHLAGVSLGGLVVLRAAARAPERVASVTAMCCAARFSPGVWRDRARSVRSAGSRVLAPQVMQRWFTPEFIRSEPTTVARYQRMFEASPAAGYAAASDVLAAADIRDDLPAITSPTIVVSGARDPANPVADQVAIAERIPFARHVVIPDAGHLVPASHAPAVAAIIRSQLER